MIKLENTYVCCVAKYISYSVSEIKSYRQTTYAEKRCQTCNHEHKGLKTLGKQYNKQLLPLQRNCKNDWIYN